MSARAATLDETQAFAARFGVCPDIHERDYLFQFHLDHPERTRQEAIEQYFSGGDYSAHFFDKVIAELAADRGRDPLSFLEFASGYGRVTRHLVRLDRYRVTACDIHPQAVDFLRDTIGVEARISDRDPERLTLDSRYDIVFALSFFSHIPARDWGPWAARLFDLVADGGLLIFTTHGRSAWKTVGMPDFEPDGHWFVPLSEQKDLPAEDYGTMLVTPHYALTQLQRRPDSHLVLFRDSHWWGIQDTYVFQKGPEVFRYKAKSI